MHLAIIPDDDVATQKARQTRREENKNEADTKEMRKSRKEENERMLRKKSQKKRRKEERMRIFHFVHREDDAGRGREKGGERQRVR